MAEPCGAVNPMSEMRCVRESDHYGDHGDTFGRYWSSRSNVVARSEHEAVVAELDRVRAECAELDRQRSVVLGFLDDVNREEWASKVLISTAIRSAYGLERDSWNGEA